MIENKKSEIFQKKYLTHVKNPTDIGTTPQHPRQEVPLFIATSNNYTTLNNKNKRIHSLYPELLKRRLKKKKGKNNIRENMVTIKKTHAFFTA